MRHGKSGRKLGRTASHRRALLSNLAVALINEKKIRTTTAKAKETRSFVERMITFAKRGDLHARRHVMRHIRHKAAVHTLFDEIAPRYSGRNGGYTRVIKLGQRSGDGAHMAFLELVGFEGVEKKATEPKGGKTKGKEETSEEG